MRLLNRLQQTNHQEIINGKNNFSSTLFISQLAWWVKIITFLMIDCMLLFKHTQCVGIIYVYKRGVKWLIL